MMLHTREVAGSKPAAPTVRPVRGPQRGHHPGPKQIRSGYNPWHISTGRLKDTTRVPPSTTVTCAVLWMTRVAPGAWKTVVKTSVKTFVR